MLTALDEISDSPSCKSGSATSPLTYNTWSKSGQNHLSHSHSSSLLQNICMKSFISREFTRQLGQTSQHKKLNLKHQQTCIQPQYHTTEPSILARYSSKAPSPQRIFPPQPGAFTDPTDSSSTTTASISSSPALTSGIWCIQALNILV